jgi:putative inorganic carbon (hco3(-)) transporter
MAVSRANRVDTQTSRGLAPFTWSRMAPADHVSAMHLAVGGVVGIVLGIYTLGIAVIPTQWVPLFILAVLCPFIAMVVGSVRRLFLMIIMLDIPFQLDVYLAYRYDAGKAIGGLIISASTVSLVILYALWFAASLARREQRPRRRIWTGPTLWLTAFLAFTTLSLVAAHDVMLSIYELFLLIQMFLLYIYVVATVRSREDIRFIVTMLLAGVVLESLVIVGLKFVGHSISFAGISASIMGDIRQAGTLKSPNRAASYLTLFLALSVSIFLTELPRFYKRLAAFTFGLGTTALVMTLSRGGWIAFVLSLMFLYFLALRQRRLSIKAPLIAAVVLLLLSILFQDVISARLYGDDQGAAYSRVPLMKLAIKIIEDNPVLGVGTNNFAAVVQQYTTPDFDGEWITVVHNKYLLVWAETGLGGLMTFLLFLGTTIRKGWQCWKLNDRLLSPISLGLTAGVVGRTGHMLVDVFNGRMELQSLWLVAGLIVAISNIGATANNDGIESTPNVLAREK